MVIYIDIVGLSIYARGIAGEKKDPRHMDRSALGGVIAKGEALSLAMWI